MINIIGFNEKSITSEVDKIIKDSDLIVVKTKFFDGFKYIENSKLNFVTLDEEFEKAEDFDTLTKNLAKAVLNYAKDKNICYIIPMYAITDASVKMLMESNEEVKIIKTESVFNDIAKDSVVDTSYAVYSAYDILNNRSICLNTNMINVIYDIDDNFLCSELKLKLFDFYGEESIVYIKQEGKVKKVKLFELDMQGEINQPITILLDKQNLISKERYNFSDLIEIMYILRGENGCPWDREQNHESIKMNMVEEAYELVEAIELDDIAKMREESGDVLLQAVFHSVIGEDMAEFNVYDCISELCQKLIFRHSHIFGLDKAEDSEKALSTWENNKVKEKGFTGVNDEILSIPKQFPSLLRMNKVFKKLIKNNIELPDNKYLIDVIKKELDKKELGEKEIGLILACVCLLSNLNKVDSEKSLMDKIEEIVSKIVKKD